MRSPLRCMSPGSGAKKGACCPAGLTPPSGGRMCSGVLCGGAPGRMSGAACPRGRGPGAGPSGRQPGGCGGTLRSRGRGGVLPGGPRSTPGRSMGGRGASPAASGASPGRLGGSRRPAMLGGSGEQPGSGRRGDKHAMSKLLRCGTSPNKMPGREAGLRDGSHARAPGGKGPCSKGQLSGNW